MFWMFHLLQHENQSLMFRGCWSLYKIKALCSCGLFPAASAQEAGSRKGCFLFLFSSVQKRKEKNPQKNPLSFCCLILNWLHVVLTLLWIYLDVYHEFKDEPRQQQTVIYPLVFM